MDRLRKFHEKKPFVPSRSRLNLKMRMIGLIGFLVISTVFVIGLFLHYFLTDTLESQLGEQALGVAESIALNPDIGAAFDEEDPSSVIQPLVAPVLEATRAEFIVVGNREQIRYSHPNPEQIGERMVGEDNERALLNGESYVSEAAGSLGRSLRAKVPIRSDGEVIGVVSVGFLAEDIQELIGDYSQEIWLTLAVVGLAALLMAIGIANYIKRILYGLEPEEISHLLFQRETILQSTLEGIIAVNDKGEITLLNERAQSLLLLDRSSEVSLIGKPIREVLPNSDLVEILKTKKSMDNQEKVYGNKEVYVNSRPIYYEGALVGAVSTFRNKDEIEQLTKELSQVKQYANALRAQTHEFSNKLYTISGLLYLDKKQEVYDFIQMEQDTQQEWIRRLIDKVADLLVSGILIGKINQASEQQIELTIDPDSRLEFPLSDVQRDALLSAIGNLVDNAIESVKEQPTDQRFISLYFTDIGEEIILEIDDSGKGFSGGEESHLFEQGFSSKQGVDRGYGLSTVKQLVLRAGGAVYVEESELGGACFVVSMPKEGSK